MTTLESKQITLNQKPQEVFDFLCDLNKIGSLMPTQVEEFITDGNSCSFTIKGMAKLSMEFESKTPYSEVILKSAGKVPFDFRLRGLIKDLGDQSVLQLLLEADLNPFLKMMAEKPLTNFLNLLVDSYEAKSNA